MKAITVKKGEILQRSNEPDGKVYIVKSGLLRSYSIDNKGKEHIYMFAPEDWTIGDNNFPNESTELFIDALEDSEILVFDKDHKFDISADETFQKLIRRMAVLQKRIIMLMSATAIERYEHFEATYPQIVQRVPQRMIASYLGITPEALSKVKGERVKSI